MQNVASLFPVCAARVLAGLPAANRSALWLADRLTQGAATSASAVRPTGFAARDAERCRGGWPAAGLTELLLAAPGSAELRLLAPALAAPAFAGAVLWIAPPCTPYAPALQALGLAPGRQLIVTPGSLADAAWVAEQGLRSGACAAVLWWQGQARSPAAALVAALRRLHLAAQEGVCPLFVLRPASMRMQASPAPLRLALEPLARGRLAVLAFKRRGPAMAAPLVLTLPASGLSARCAPQRSPARLAAASIESGDAVVRIAPERIAA
jgi:protein ImuA